MIKILNISRMISFVITALTSIPLAITYFQSIDPKNELVVHLHVIFGIIFIVTAIPSMIIRKRQNN